MFVSDFYVGQGAVLEIDTAMVVAGTSPSSAVSISAMPQNNLQMAALSTQLWPGDFPWPISPR